MRRGGFDGEILFYVLSEKINFDIPVGTVMIGCGTCGGECGSLQINEHKKIVGEWRVVVVRDLSSLARFRLILSWMLEESFIDDRLYELEKDDILLLE